MQTKMKKSQNEDNSKYEDQLKPKGNLKKENNLENKNDLNATPFTCSSGFYSELFYRNFNNIIQI